MKLYLRPMLSSRCFLLLVVSLLFVANVATALVMKGRVYDMRTNAPLANVNIFNTFTETGMTTDSTGAFEISVQRGHLVEFRKIGYKVARVRIDAENLPFYNIALREGSIDLDEVQIKGHNYKSDSIENRETYKWAIEHYTLSAFDAIQHPFDALSKRNRRIWAFQKRYEYFEQEKFVDYVFNAKLIANIGKIDSTHIDEYRMLYRPTYEQIKSMTDYEFLEYVKATAAAYLRRRE
ncbi:MAG: carboxypeptidase-like regulatory domain-containing protein [Edaphocola sp.]